ncbi:MAG: phenylalanine--tRNA ligase subunit alpha [Thermoplasmata archaeon]|nr:MAG: phenylalanine--tRNA ligase subunit alpha [Thermoplasmata archaeon]
MEEEKLSPMEKEVLLALKEYGGKATSDELMKRGLELVKIMNASSWLQSKGLVSMQENLKKIYFLTPEGEKFLLEGFPENKILEEIKDEGKSFGELERKFGKKEMSIAIGWILRKQWGKIEKKGEEKYVVITEKGKEAIKKKGEEEKALECIKEGKEIKEEIADILKKRGAIKEKEKIERVILLTKEGIELVEKGIEMKEEISQLTSSIIKNGAWKKHGLRKYDVHAFAPPLHPGKLHPLTQFIQKVRNIFIEMGFTEIKGGYVESCFWNMDALFIPQDHPARDLQDTFYCKNPKKIEIVDDLLKKIACVHENGGDTGSKGWGYRFSKKEAKKVLLRTHTTVNTIRFLSENPHPPAKIFSIGKVFRRENIDATHLPEFYQIEGIIHEKNANFCMLIGILEEFYKRMGFEKIRFRPAYFPYTEPSMEIEVKWHGKWMELGGSGIFRPEVTKPFGVEKPVLAWGLGLERMAMMLLGLSDIRELYFSDIHWLQELPLL